MARMALAAVGAMLVVAGWIMPAHASNEMQQGVDRAPPAAATDGQGELKVRITWGHAAPEAETFAVELAGKEVTVVGVAGIDLESDDRLVARACESHAGNGDVDGIVCTLRYTPREIRPIEKVQRIWADLLAQSDPDTVRRLQQDPAYRPDPRVLTVRMDRDGTKGFSVTVDQLLQSRVFWVPSLDVYLAAGDGAPSWAEHQEQLVAFKGRRILDRVEDEPEATYEQFTTRWEDMGSPAYRHPAQPAPGHIVGLTWDSALYKFGIDRGAGVWNDYGNPDRFRFWFDFGDLSRGIQPYWQGQRLQDGLPVITTTIERQGLRYQVEQLAYPLHGPPAERRGDIPMVLLQKLTVTNLQRDSGSGSVTLHHRRQYSASDRSRALWRQQGDTILFEENTSRRVLFAVQGAGLTVASCTNRVEGPPKDRHWKDCAVVLTFRVAKNRSKDLVVKLPSPPVEPRDGPELLELDYGAARAATLGFWTDWLGRGAQFRVPEKVVNDLFRASLWHALRLPRRHGGREEAVRIDLPYSNFAYDQHGTPWPVNQAVYVDYMLYGLRGYDAVAAEELLTMYRGNQESSGHVKGYANWGVYTPAMIYTVAQNYLLCGNRASFDELLPYTLKALDWCLEQVRQARVGTASSTSRETGSAASFAGGLPATDGLVRAPLNDLTGEGVWAFTQAYLYAAFDTLGRALERVNHPRAQECLETAREFRRRVERAFAAAAVRSPLVPLRDHTWMPYVPCEATQPGRRFEQWYPTDVDTGATHLLRLQALPPSGPLADALLNDHEDNLYLHGWGMANEPVYNPQATAYLLRDEPKAAIRAFYSYMACAFSHSALEPVEHRWTWGQYFGPPSTDGAWFELYRHMLIRELEDGSLLLLEATPRPWLADGQQIVVERAPTYFGELSMTVDSRAASGSITATVEMPSRAPMRRLLVRFRHPEAQPLRSVTVNGRDWADFEAQKEWVVIDQPVEPRYVITGRY